MNFETFLLINLLICFGSFIQTTIGFGAAALVSPVIFYIDKEYIPAPLLVSMTFLCILNTFGNLKEISFSKVSVAFIGRILGTFFAVWVLSFINVQYFALIIGISVLIAVGMSIKKISIQPLPINCLIAGYFSGFAGTLTAIGGPPIILLYQNEKYKKLKGELPLFFAFGSMLSVIILLFFGETSFNLLAKGLLLIPGIIIGFTLGHLFSRYIKEEVIKPFILIICSVSAFSLIIRNFF